jgi:hypothetical protein
MASEVPVVPRDHYILALERRYYVVPRRFLVLRLRPC